MAIQPIPTELRRKHATATTFCFQTDGDTSENWSAGDVKVYRHTGGSWVNANIGTLPSPIVPGVTGMVSYICTLTAAEMTTDNVIYPIIVALDNGSSWLHVYIYTEAIGANMIEINGGRTDGNNATLKLKSLEAVNTAGHGAVFQGSTGYSGIVGIGGSQGAYFAGIDTNAYGIVSNGKGSRAGILLKGGATAPGALVEGGSTSGDGIKITTIAGNGILVHSRGGDAIHAESDSGGHGIYARAVDSVYSGMHLLGSISGLNCYGGNEGIRAQGFEVGILGIIDGEDEGEGPGIKGVGGGTGAGLELVGGSSGKDIDADEIDNIKSDTSNIESKIDIIDNNVGISLNNQTNIESKINTINTNIDTSLDNQTDIENKINVIDANIDTSLVNQGSIEGKINTIDNNVDISLINQINIESKVDVIDDKIDDLNNITVADILAQCTLSLNNYGVPTSTEMGIYFSELNDITVQDILDGSVDGETVDYCFQLMMARVNGEYDKDNPNPGDISFKKRDNNTELTKVNVTATGRTRIS